MRLACVLDEKHSAAIGDAPEGTHVRHLPIEVYRNDELGTRSDRCFDSGNVDVVILRSYVNDDWDAAAHAYAAEHDRYFGALHATEHVLSELLYDLGPAAEARRERAFARLAQAPAPYLDIVGLGPEAPRAEDARRYLFAA